MMQIYKKRQFGELISDTFNFFKEHGKNYFKNYLMINGLIIILLVVVIVFAFKDVFPMLFNSNMQGSSSYLFEQYFTENMGSLIVLGVLMFLIILMLSLVNYTFPVLYLKRLAETGNKDITTDEMVSDIKKNVGKFFKFFLWSLITLLPIIVIASLISVALMFIVIGIFLFLFILPVFANISNFTFFDYFTTNKGFIDSLSEGFRIQFSKFWNYFGSVVIIYIIMNVISYVFTMLPMSIIAGTAFAAPIDQGAENGSNPILMILLFIVYLVSIIMSLLLSNIIYINAGLMYYDSRTDLHRSVDMLEIDTIGSSAV
ncbi:hypothetical protein GCM10010992_09000 [Cloacibacterium rupense]|uniref:Membrane domain of glycerophosphoryl diester phosphodiesterase n=1 Tax=Cloacibacterium rupense TaxID=517423 RepID=A0ABQ2NGN6_9FLAO|nr:hypothetical protein [Cloacibacterium rupense]GGP02870.1 hypothetical protein GCM10010992_09000 [Cloacibacterium rupense]